MHRLICLPVLALAACGTEDDRRPRTVEYITHAILAPSCGNAQCHSSFYQAENLTFDTVETARRTLVSEQLLGTITLNAMNEPVGEAAASRLYDVLTREISRMPYDQPLPEPDIALIERWIDFGAPGAQCDPEAGPQCIGDRLVECKESFDFGAVTNCAAMGKRCTAGACL